MPVARLFFTNLTHFFFLFIDQVERCQIVQKWSAGDDNQTLINKHHITNACFCKVHRSLYNHITMGKLCKSYDTFMTFTNDLPQRRIIVQNGQITIVLRSWNYVNLRCFYEDQRSFYNWKNYVILRSLYEVQRSFYDGITIGGLRCFYDVSR